jgi:hypothetical protein
MSYYAPEWSNINFTYINICKGKLTLQFQASEVLKKAHKAQTQPPLMQAIQLRQREFKGLPSIRPSPTIFARGAEHLRKGGDRPAS